MPVVDPLQGATFLPGWNEPYQVPQTISDMYQFLLSRSIPRFTTTAERDAAYPAPVTGQQAFAAGVLYVRSVSAWVALWSTAGPVAITAGSGYTSSGVSQILTPGWVTLSGALDKAAAPLVRAVTIGTLTAAHRPTDGLRRVPVSLGSAAPAGSGTSALSIGTDGTMLLTADASQLAAQIKVFLDGVTFRLTSV